MKAMVLEKIGRLSKNSLLLQNLPLPTVEKGEVRLRVLACGVCRTDLHLIEGDLPNPILPMIPGHQVVGIVDEIGPSCTLRKVGDRVGAAWLRHTCGKCEYCVADKENLCPYSSYTGYQKPGGYAEYLVVPEDYLYEIPSEFSDVEAAPLLCAGIIGYRTFKQARVPKKGKLGIIGFGSSAHLIIQVALYEQCEVYVISRDRKHQELAKEMGATWVGGANEAFPKSLDSVIVFAPVGTVVPFALQSLKPGGTVSLAGISLTDIPAMNYEECLFHEKTLVSTEANTRQDGRELFRYATQIPIRPRTTIYALEEANQALADLKEDKLQGTAVLRIAS